MPSRLRLPAFLASTLVLLLVPALVRAQDWVDCLPKLEDGTCPAPARECCPDPDPWLPPIPDGTVVSTHPFIEFGGAWVNSTNDAANFGCWAGRNLSPDMS